MKGSCTLADHPAGRGPTSLATIRHFLSSALQPGTSLHRRSRTGPSMLNGSPFRIRPYTCTGTST
jgi:hypothetical protein